MADGVYRVFRFALCSRVLVLVLQIVFNNLVTDYDSSSLRDRETNKPLDAYISISLQGFTMWDSAYFIDIARNGYMYEQFMAFFPLYPLLMRILATPLYFAFGSLISLTSILVIAGWWVSCVCFIIAALVLYQLTLLKFKNEHIAVFTSFLFCINPATIFMNGLYSESLFACCLFSGLYILETSSDIKHTILASIVFACGSGTRSNGIISIGFLSHFILKRLCTLLWYRTGPKMAYKQATWKQRLSTVCTTACTLMTSNLIILLPFIAYQFYGYLIYCKRTTQTSPPWCKKFIPLSYSYIQDHYWNVGFLRYYQVKQIPNFLLAMPMVGLCVASVVEYGHSNRVIWTIKTLGLWVERNSIGHYSSDVDRTYYDPGMFVYIVHLAFLTVFAVTSIHIQVMTRMIASSSPLIYWYAGHVIAKGSNPGYTRLIVGYFLTYFTLGIIMHCNFYPWT